MGNWLDINGEAIYETRKWDGAENNNSENVFFTKKGNDLYVLCTEFPGKPITVKGIKNAGKVSMLGFDGSIKSKKSGNTITITPPALSPLNNPSPYAWVFKIDNSL
jgi:alpha-L-fucosidase